MINSRVIPSVARNLQLRPSAVMALGMSALLGIPAWSAASAQASDHSNDAVMRAMRDELARSMEQLRLDTLPKPYFIAYRVTESEGTGVAARLGSLVTAPETARRSRFASVEVRVGDYNFDNSNYVGAGFMPTEFVGSGQIPIDDDYGAIRRQLWIATDRAYKQALEALTQKRAALETRSRGDDTPDFSREPAHTDVDEVPPAPTNRADAEALVRTLSAVFRGLPDIYNSRASFSSGWTLTRYVNSEGTFFTRAAPRVSVTITANTQAADGMPLSDVFSLDVRTQADLPRRDSLLSAARALASRLAQLRQAALAAAYEGPVLFEDRAAAELFNAVITPRLVGIRRPVTTAELGRFMGEMTNDWQDAIGAPVLPKFLTVVDDPTKRTIDGVVVEGYHVDDDGVPARPTTVIDHGVLKTLLTTRVPVAGVERSTGNRRGFGPAPSTLIVTADSALADDALRRRLIEMATAQGLSYAVVVRRIMDGRSPQEGGGEVIFVSAGMGDGGGDGPRVASLAAFRVYPDGREEMIRAAEITGVSAASFKNIVAVSQRRTITTTAFVSRGGMFGGGGGGTVSYVVPSLLFTNVTLRRPRGSNPRLPIVPPPLDR